MKHTLRFTGSAIPERATRNSAGYDLCLPEDIHIERFGSAEVLLPVTFDIPAGVRPLVLPRSSALKKLRLFVSGTCKKDGIRLLLEDRTVGMEETPEDGRSIPEGTAAAQLLFIASEWSDFSAGIYRVQEKARMLTRLYVPAEVKFPFLTLKEQATPPSGVSLVPTGLAFDIKEDEVLFVKTTSDFENFTGLRQANDVGVIDSDYFGNPDNLGHVYIPVYNPCASVSRIPEGIKIADGFLCRYYTAENEVVPDSIRSGGFGSTDSSEA